MKKQYQGSCVDNPFHNLKRLNEVIDNAKDISSKKFFDNVDADDFISFGEPLKVSVKRFPHSYDFYSYKNKIYFFVNSAIEYFFW